MLISGGYDAIQSDFSVRIFNREGKLVYRKPKENPTPLTGTELLAVFKGYKRDVERGLCPQEG